jgi:magnesium transporter
VRLTRNQPNGPSRFKFFENGQSGTERNCVGLACGLTSLAFRAALRGCLERYMTIFDLTQPLGPLNHLSAADIAAQLQALPSEKRTKVLEHLVTGAVGEATEDFHKGAAISTPLGNLSTATAGLLYRKRVFWLVLLVFGNLFSGAGIAAFEDVIAANIVLVFFLPLLVDSGGNAGAQSATLMVRALATGDVVMKDWLRLLWRECSVALALGVTMAVAVALLGAMRGGWNVSMVVASSMLIIVLIGSLIGHEPAIPVQPTTHGPCGGKRAVDYIDCRCSGSVGVLRNCFGDSGALRAPV